jgi:hypothetical protein
MHSLDYVVVFAVIVSICHTEPCFDQTIHNDDLGIDEKMTCIASKCCFGQAFKAGLCPDYAADVKCCMTWDTCNMCGDENDWPFYRYKQVCNNAIAKEYACKLLQLFRAGQLTLKSRHDDPRGNDPYDGASPLSQIHDTCQGLKVKRSRYGTAPKGCVCLAGKPLQVIYDYAIQFYGEHRKPIRINSIAGSSHSANSLHYQGKAIDVACKDPLDHCNETKTFCQEQNAHQVCYPGSTCGGHETWVHCDFRNHN